MKKIVVPILLAVVLLAPTLATASLPDTDGDLYTDNFELYKGTDPYDQNVKPLCCGGSVDSDGDRYLDSVEGAAGTDIADPTSHPTDVAPDADTDSDGILDQKEVYMYGTDPNSPDTDNDGISDFDEVKANCCDDLTADIDGDGLTNGEEFDYGTDLETADTDGDGFDDGEEIAAGTDPLNANSFPGGPGGAAVSVPAIGTTAGALIGLLIIAVIALVVWRRYKG